MTIKHWLRRLFCSHEFSIRKLHRRADGMIESPCVKCDKVCEATHGLALKGKLVA